MKSALEPLRTKQSPVKPHIRWMVLSDLPDVLSIERQQFGAIARDENDFRDYLGSRSYIGQVAELGGEIHGYMIYGLYRHHIHVVNIAVHPCSLRCGIGSAMIRELTRGLSIARRWRLEIEVLESDLRGQLWLRSLGLKATRTIRNFYEDFYTTEDAYRFEYRVPEYAGK